MAFLTLRKCDSSPELIGKIVTIKDASASERWKVEVEGQVLEVSPSGLELRYATDVQELRSSEVILEGLASKPELNGQRAKLGSFLAHRQRWKVLVDKKTMLLRSQALTLVESGKAVVDPVGVDACSLQSEKGLFAMRDMKAGQIIMEEEPFIASPMHQNFSEQVKNHADAFLSASDEQRKKALSLHPNASVRISQDTANRSGSWVRTSDAKEGMKTLGLDKSVPAARQADVWKFLAVMQANAYAMGNNTHALFDNLCRANHSCTPSAVRFDQGSNKVLVAVRDILAGDEISINYLSDTQILEPISHRKNFLDKFGFDCCCQSCARQLDTTRAFACAHYPKCGGICIVADGVLSSCSLCQKKAGPKFTAGRLKEEADLIHEMAEFDSNPFMMGMQGSASLEQLIGRAEASLSPLHWAVARLHLIASDYYQQVQDFKRALQHMSSELQFWEFHLDRPSQQAAWKRKMRADVLTSTGNFAMAFNEYCLALKEIQTVMPTDSHYCNTIKENLQEVLQFRRPPKKPTVSGGYGGAGAPPCPQQ